MTSNDRRGWLIVFCLFICLFVLFGGGYNSSGVFFEPMRQYFNWSSARQSSLQTILALTAGASAPLFGCLLDRVNARIVMSAGIILATAALLLASHAHAYHTLVVAFIALGLAIGAATLLPTGLVIANWFSTRRGLALGVATSGTSLGGMVMTIVLARVIAIWGWRAGFSVLALPTLIIVAPLVALFVDSRPSDMQEPQEESANPLAGGLDVRSAIHSRPFWMICTAQFCYSVAAAGATVHTIPYLLREGFEPKRAAAIFAVTFGLASVGKFIIGYGADLLTARVALSLTLAVAAVGQILLLVARAQSVPYPYVGLYGLTSGAPLALIPMLIAESCGLKRFGSISGFVGILMTLGGAVGPPIGGLLVDHNFGYPTVFVIFGIVLGVGSVAALACPSVSRAANTSHLPQAPSTI